MSVIPKRIAGVVLHMPDQHVMPVCNIERAVGGELQIHRPEIGIISPEQILTVAAAVARSVILQGVRSEEHTSELQSRGHLVCRLLLEKKKKSRNKMKYPQHN